jgi:hypothetical protein
MNVNFIPDPHTQYQRIQAIRETLTNGGGTFTASAEPVDVSGFYVVGGSDPSVVIPVQTDHFSENEKWPKDRQLLETYQDSDGDASGTVGVYPKVGEIERLATAFDKFVRTHSVNILVGTWLHEGKIHFDAVQLIEDREAAEKLGRDRGEIAIFDGTTFEDITL